MPLTPQPKNDPKLVIYFFLHVGSVVVFLVVYVEGI
jgi:hypothetical protein